MSINKVALLALLATALTTTGCRTCVYSGAWEYETKKVYLTPGNLKMFEKSLNDLGRDGWSVVSVTPLQPIESTYSGAYETLLILKRAKQ
jgi:hypothetical protein